MSIAIALAGTAHAKDRNSYQATILVSNEAEDAPVVDPLLRNAWGIAASPASPWWVSNNASGSSTLYTGAGVKRSLEVFIDGGPTGMVWNGGPEFLLDNGKPAVFMWAGDDGNFWGWNGTLADPTHAQVVKSEPGSVYLGLAIHGNTLYTAAFTECEVETLDGTFEEFDTSGEFEDDSVPAGYCPFGIQVIGDSVFVAYALSDGEEEIHGQGLGVVREFDTDGNLIAAVADGGQLNSPWGMAMAPTDFGRFSNCLIVGNFGDGQLNAFCKDDEGEWHHGGELRQGKRPLVIDGLWGIGFGNGAGAGPTNVLYFAAGPDDEVNGYFGRIDVGP